VRCITGRANVACRGTPSSQDQDEKSSVLLARWTCVATIPSSSTATSPTCNPRSPGGASASFAAAERAPAPATEKVPPASPAPWSATPCLTPLPPRPPPATSPPTPRPEPAATMHGLPSPWSGASRHRHRRDPHRHL